MVGMPWTLPARRTCWTPDLSLFDCARSVPVSAAPEPSTEPVHKPRRQAAPSMLRSGAIVEADRETWSRCGPWGSLLLMISIGLVGGTPLPLPKICANPFALAATVPSDTGTPLDCESTTAKL